MDTANAQVAGAKNILMISPPTLKSSIEIPQTFNNNMIIPIETKRGLTSGDFNFLLSHKLNSYTKMQSTIPNNGEVVISLIFAASPKTILQFNDQLYGKCGGCKCQKGGKYTYN